VVTAGFADPVAAAQSTFRAILAATARPGTVNPVEAAVAPPAPLSRGAAALALTLCDRSTPVWLDAGLRATESVAAWLRFHCGVKIVDRPEAASFAFAVDPRQLPDFDSFALGSADYPDRSTTIVLLVDSFHAGPTLVLSGPGIRDRRSFCAAPLPNDIVERLAANRKLFPRGVDLLLVCADAVAALPRSVRLQNKDVPSCM